MSPVQQAPIRLAEGRFARLEAIEWWDRSRIETARVMVIGAGALGNEVLKNLALLGVRQVVVVDFDRIESSNLSRSVLFREGDEGRAKAACAAERMSELCPAIRPRAIVGNVLGEVGLGYFRWADVIVGAVDNREARVFVNATCAQLQRPWIDGGIEVLHGIVRGFAPPATACYECTMSQADWRLIHERRSCSLIARRAAEHRGTPTTPTVASVIGGMQAQEVLKALHGLEFLRGRGFFFDGLGHTSYAIEYPIQPDCGWHEPPPPVEELAAMTSQTSLRELAEIAMSRLGGLDAIDLAREQVRELECPVCGWRSEVWQPVDSIPAEMGLCAKCGQETVPVPFHSLAPGSDLLDRSPGSLGLPAWDIVWARFGDSCLGLEISGDCPFRGGNERQKARHEGGGA